jgi:hypothetical protein
MKNIVTKFVAGAAIFAIATASYAQLGNLTSALSGGSSGGSVSADQIVKKYVGGSKSVLNADSKMLEAVGLKDEAAVAALQAKNLTEGATKDSLEEATKVQTASSKALEDKLKDKNTKLDADGKKKFSEGLGELGKGVIQYAGAITDVKGFKPSLTSIGGAASSALFIGKSLPDTMTNLGKSLMKAIEFAKANDIPVPKEATDATALL